MRHSRQNRIEDEHDNDGAAAARHSVQGEGKARNVVVAKSPECRRGRTHLHTALTVGQPASSVCGARFAIPLLAMDGVRGRAGMHAHDQLAVGWHRGRPKGWDGGSPPPKNANF